MSRLRQAGDSAEVRSKEADMKDGGRRLMTSTTQRLIYIAGGSSERPFVASLIERVRAIGWTVTHDWTRSEGYGRPTTEDERLSYARTDLDAVDRAEVIWCIVPEAKSEGMMAEFMHARNAGKLTIVSGPHARRKDRIFLLLADMHYSTHEEALASLGRGKLALADATR